MKAVVQIAVLCCLLYGCSEPGEDRVRADFLFENVNVVPMDEEVILRQQAVAVRDGEIIAVVDSAQADRFNAAMRIKGEGRYLMPGLSDRHVHIRWDPQTMFKLFLANGVTTVFNMGLADGGDAVDHVQLRADIASGAITGPRYFISGPQLNGEVLPNVDAVAPMLDRHLSAPYDLVKVHGDLSADVYEALIAGARERNLPIAGHMQHAMPLEKSLQMDAIEHAEEFLYTAPDDFFSDVTDMDSFLDAYRANAQRLADPAHRAAIVQAVAESGVYLDVTMVVYANIPVWADDERLAALGNDELMRYLPQSVKDRWLSADSNPYQAEDFPITAEEVEDNIGTLFLLVNELHEAGVPLLSGADAFGTLVPGFSLHQELQRMSRAGLSPFEALQTSTVNLAAYLGDSNTAGKIRPGYRADFILLDKNPLTDIANTQSVSGVFTQGRWYSREDIQAFLSTAISNSSSE